MELLNNVKQFLTKGQARTVKAKVNIIYSFGIKFVNIGIHLLFVPLLIDYLGTEEYGIWLILVSIIGWLSFFDIGIGHGLRNMFAEAKARGDVKHARIYVSTAYATITIIFLLVGLIIGSLIPFINWNTIFNTGVIANNKLVYIVLVVFGFFMLRFITQLISIILLADQRTALANSLNLISNFIILIVILTLRQFSASSLLFLSFFLSGIPVLVFVIASIYYFKKDYYQFRPSISFVKMKYARPLLNLGLKFLFLQFSVVMFMSATNFIVAQFYSPKEVVIYNIAFKYFAVISMFWGIIQTPMWSAITEAFHVDDFKWIRKMMQKLKHLAIGGSLIILIMLLFSDSIYTLWVGKNIAVPFSLSVSLAASSLVFIFFTPFSIFLNGVSKIQLSTILTIFQLIIYIPLAYLFAKTLNFGLAGIIFAAIFCELPLRITQPFQYSKIINKTATGVWNK
jgi:O-antigen/teichoic acid export membrane protein